MIKNNVLGQLFKHNAIRRLCLYTDRTVVQNTSLIII